MNNSFYYFAIFFAFAAAIFIFFTVKRLIALIREVKHVTKGEYKSTDAQIEKIEETRERISNGRDVTMYAVTVTFKDEFGESHSHKLAQHFSVRPGKNKTYRVYYQPTNPKDCIVLGDHTKISYFLMWLTMAVIFTASAIASLIYAINS
jgi:hypothetical protein